MKYIVPTATEQTWIARTEEWPKDEMNISDRRWKVIKHQKSVRNKTA